MCERPLEAIAVSYLSSHESVEGDAYYEVGPDDVQHLQHQQQTVKDPPWGVWPDDLPAFKHSTVQDPITHTHTKKTLLTPVLLYQTSGQKQQLL